MPAHIRTLAHRIRVQNALEKRTLSTDVLLIFLLLKMDLEKVFGELEVIQSENIDLCEKVSPKVR